MALIDNNINIDQFINLDFKNFRMIRYQIRFRDGTLVGNDEELYNNENILSLFNTIFNQIHNFNLPPYIEVNEPSYCFLNGNYYATDFMNKIDKISFHIKVGDDSHCIQYRGFIMDDLQINQQPIDIANVFKFFNWSDVNNQTFSDVSEQIGFFIQNYLVQELPGMLA
jgi:hypothetical protein